MEKRLIIFIALTFIVLLLYIKLFPPPKPYRKVGQEQAVQKVVRKRSIANRKTNLTVPSEIETRGSRVPSSKVTNIKYAKRIDVETPLYRAVFTTFGGRLISWRLKKYKDIMGPKGKPVELVRALPPDLPLKGVFERRENSIVDNVLMQVSRKNIRIKKGGSPTNLVFVGVKDGLRITKRYRFYPNRYEVNVDWILENDTDQKLVGNAIMTLVNKPSLIKEKSKYGHHDFSADIMKGNSIIRKKLKKLKRPVRIEGAIKWASLNEKYFVMLLSPEGVAFNEVLLKPKNKALTAELVATSVVIDPGRKAQYQFKMYNGPKLLSNLKRFGKNADKVIDYGWFGIIARPLMQFLNLTHGFTHNYGIDIIILTILIKIIFWPLTHKSYKSMSDMQKIQPLMQKLREQYKDNKERLNQEMMRLYKQHKVNPLGGCLPMLLQIPVFFALYKALLISVELRHAPFIWWIHDLSAKDPYYITPIIMGVTMLIQQKMTPSTGDPKMAKMMLIMPIVFTFMFLNFPSGLVIYWLINNVLSIGQQMYTNRKLAHGR